MRTRFVPLVAAGILALVTSAAPVSVAGAVPTQDLPNGAPDIEPAAVTKHLQRWQAIADANGGDRATGSPGYQASVEYVRQQVESFGYEVRVQRFSTVAGESANVIATLPGQDPGTVAMAGAHLDSVGSGPGVNDNGTGSASLLAVAEAFAERNPNPPVTVRFGWWGAEEQGLLGSEHYVGSLSGGERDQITSYLNFDMTGSPNAGYFLYGNSSGLRGLFREYYTAIDVPTEGTDISGRSDHASFADAGIEVAGLFSGAEQSKSQAQADKWGGTAGRAFDPCYHSACDTIDNVDTTALDRNADAISYSVWGLAGAAPGGAGG